MSQEITIQLGVPEDHAAAATALYCEAFREKLAPFLGDQERSARFLAASLAPDRAFLAIKAGQVVGIAGFKVDGKGLFEPGFARFFAEYGVSAVLRIGGLLLLERAESPDVLLMDGIALSPSVRGQGIGSRLLDAIEAHARELGKASIRLDVVDTNSGARRLYERFGFKARKTTSTGLLGRLFSFRASTDMRKSLA
ncbi:MAG: GNAT family N-acetyltransferase [Pseudomonadota bacterium]